MWAKDTDYFKDTYKKRILVKKEKEQAIELLVENFKEIVANLTPLLIDFFQAYNTRKHHSGEVLRSNFNDWLKMSFRAEDFAEGTDEETQEIVELFCRETSYVLLGRILFTRICEDKEILPQCISGGGMVESLLYHRRRKRRNSYLRILEDSRATIEEYYKHFYELGFFDWWLVLPGKRNLLADLELETQRNLEESLNFILRKCLISLNRFDFALVDKDILGDVYQGYLPYGERKTLGEFYTPQEVIEYILDAVGFQSGKNITTTKILDPSCGSGGFLVEAIQRLMRQYERMGFEFKRPKDAKQIVEGCVNSVYGFDIHPFACFIAEMNILFQLLELFNVVAREDRSYRIPRINIYRTDSLALPGGDVILGLSVFLDNSRRVALVEEARRAEEVKKGEFDFVVGNPPYVRMERIAEDERRYYMDNYDSGKVLRPDLYILFMERGIMWLKEKGKLGYIVQNKFLALDNGRKLREYILNRCCIEQIVDVSNVKVFSESVPYPVIIILRSEKELEKRLQNSLRVVIMREDDPKILSELKKSDN